MPRDRLVHGQNVYNEKPHFYAHIAAACYTDSNKLQDNMGIYAVMLQPSFRSRSRVTGVVDADRLRGIMEEETSITLQHTPSR